jgi:hypothetical protein
MLAFNPIFDESHGVSKAKDCALHGTGHHLADRKCACESIVASSFGSIKCSETSATNHRFKRAGAGAGAAGIWNYRCRDNDRSSSREPG